MDRFSPVAGASVGVLVLPIGQFERSRFTAFLNRLKDEVSIIQLSELQSYTEDSEVLLSPRKFPQGSLLYNYTSSLPSAQQQQLSPFELFREPLLVIGVKDGFQYGDEQGNEELRGAAEYIRERHPRVVHRQILVLDDSESTTATDKDNVIRIRNVAQQRDPSLRHAIYQMSARFLGELSVYSRAMLASPGIQTPGQTARSLQRTTSLKEREKQLVSGYKTPPQGAEVSSAAEPGDQGVSKELPLSRSPPPTSFDQITNANGPVSRPTRPDSRASNTSKSSARASSQDRISTQGFGSATSHDKLKSRGKARVGVVVGFVHLMAGQWSEALGLFIEHTSRAKLLSDHLWLAKGMEGIVICLLLHAWAGLDFLIPSICYHTTERTSSANLQRLSVNLPSEFRATDSQQSPPSRLSACLPDLLRDILSLYHSGEGSLELPFISIAEVTIRFCKLLAMLHRSGGELDQETLTEFFHKSETDALRPEAALSRPAFGSLPKSAIADMLLDANPLAEDNISVADYAAILAGSASVYALLQMNRKKAATIKDLVVRLTASLVSARKRGAAEMGIHPAASLSAETGASTILSIAEESGGLSHMMTDVASIYGVALPGPSDSELETQISNCFGSDTLKLEFMRVLAAFYEASPDPYGVLRVNAAMLRTFGPSAAVDAEPLVISTSLSREEQQRCVMAINRTIGVANMLGLPGTEPVYWDDFLIRDIEFIPAEPAQAVIDYSKLKSGKAKDATPGNPLLYDPNANRPGTGVGVQQTRILVENETSVCRVTLQNPYDVSVEVESLHIITEGVELDITQQKSTLRPFGIQRVMLPVLPRSPGECKVTGCLVKIHGCQERVFNITSKPWYPVAPTRIKKLGQSLNTSSKPSESEDKADPPQNAIVAVTVIPPQPTLVLDNNTVLESNLMLLDGEICELSFTIRNNSDVAACIFEISTSDNAVQLQEVLGDDDDSSDVSSSAEAKVVEPGSSVGYTFDVVGKSNVSNVQITFHYRRDGDESNYARILSVPIAITVNAGMQVQLLDCLPMDIAENGEYSFVFAFDVANAWPKPMFYSCFVSDLGLKSAEPRRCHNHEGVLGPGQVQRVFIPVARLWALTDKDEDVEMVRKALVDRLRIIWNIESEERMGEVDVSNLKLSPEALEVVVGGAIFLSLEVTDIDGEPPPTEPIVSAKAGSFVTLRATLRNRSPYSLPLVLRLRPRSLNTSDPTLDDRHIAVAGSDYRLVAPMSEDARETVDFIVCPLLAGWIELEVVVKAALPGKQSGPQWTSHQKLLLNVV